MQANYGITNTVIKLNLNKTNGRLIMSTVSVLLEDKMNSLRHAVSWAEKNPGVYEMLGAMPDSDIAEKINCKVNTVRRYRLIFGIQFARSSGLQMVSTKESLDYFKRLVVQYPVKKASRNKYEKKYPGIFELLGSKTDQFVGDKYGLSRETVRKIRIKFDIASNRDSAVLASMTDQGAGDNQSQNEFTIKINKETARSLLMINEMIVSNLSEITRIANSSGE